MKLAKLSIPRRRVCGSTMSSGSGMRSHAFIRSAETPSASSFGKRSFVMPISLRYASAPKASSVACCPFQPNRPTRGWPVARSITRAARPLMPSRLRSEGSSSARSCSSLIASTRPAPKSGIGIRRAKTVASSGKIDLTAVAGHGEQLEQRLARRIERLELALRVPPGRAQFENDAAAADGRHVVADRAARAVEGRAEALVRRLDFEEVLEAEPELGELGR